MQFKCSKCGNEDPRKIGFKNGIPYCRACIKYKAPQIQGTNTYMPKEVCIDLHYDLTEKQKELSKSLVTNYKDKKNSLVNAVCGAGKTEIVLEVIKYCLEEGGKVGFAIPRKDVVIEIYNRLRLIFTDVNSIYVCGGHNKDLEGDLICLTTHQLHKYQKYFDLLIVDEIDAFPYNGDFVLESHLKQSLKGVSIFLSATPSINLVEEFSYKDNSLLKLSERFHRQPIPVPKVISKINSFQLFELLSHLKKFKKTNKPALIFCPTIEICEKFYSITSKFIRSVNYVHSKKEDRNETIKAFKDRKYLFLFTTSVLERGITIKDLQVVVLNADHELFTTESLIQISGRVGRKKDSPDGEILFICEEVSDSIKKCIESIRRSNSTL